MTVQRQVKSCGVLVLRAHPEPGFLLLARGDRLDLPKGHLEPGESELDCALRELREETGISRRAINLAPGFRHEARYQARYRRFGGAVVDKTVVIFAGWLCQEVEIRPTEHHRYLWHPWRPPHWLQCKTLDPLLARIADSELGHRLDLYAN